MRNPDQAGLTGASASETRLPGIGIRYDFVTQKGDRIAIVHHRTGQRELVFYEPEDPDCVNLTVELDESDSRSLAELLGGTKVAEHLTKLQQSVEGLAIDQLVLEADSPYVGRTIGDTGARTKTGTSIVAILRKDQTFPAPGPEFQLELGDNVVVVGTGAGIKAVNQILQFG